MKDKIICFIYNRNEKIDKKATNVIKSYKETIKCFTCSSQIDITFSNNETIRMIDYSLSESNWNDGINKLTV